MYDRTTLESFYAKEVAHPEKPFLHQPFGERWETYTWGEVGQMARRVAAFLNDQGLKPGSHIGLVSKNCREWIIADLAIMMAGHVSVPFFATLTGEQIAEVLELGDVDLLFVGKTEVWNSMKTGIPDEMPVVRFPHYPGNDVVDRGTDWDEILRDYQPIPGQPVPDRSGLWTLIFTSGTTGTPKGVMLSIENQIALMRELYPKNPLENDYQGNNRYFSFLPLNHVAERGTIETMCLTHGGEIFFTESIDRFAANLQHARPTFFFAVPRIWTKLQQGVLKKLPQEKLDTLLKVPVVSWFIKRKIRKGLGLDQSRCNVTGAAPIAQATKDWFARIGIPISEAYAMTENGAVSHMIFAHQNKPGSVGQTLPGTECRIDPESGEVLTRSPYTMVGYYKEAEKTAETIDADGWLHTGDQGREDEDGFLYLIGRVKDTFKTSKAKFIVPNEIEEKFAGNTDVDQLCILGLGMPQPMLVVSLSEIGQERDREAVKAQLEAQLAEVNAKLPSYKKVATVVIAKEPFSIENDRLTPTLKVKRPQVHAFYRERMEGWIMGGERVVFE
ncbi:long-subunit acyl-CoA synthetase (AMP-forming) [Lewinella marina]|uniref:AMP-dependent synthetase n=1 Tax=Neolewinella marina TaxID=438751 RepID=A0A2G0CJN6_9BACT|nr:AMP-binding protein [Neolewinella marina]NJB84669.1 long-subunit acyl-CoA synthetase (AMP-forming) [Neolewinella marina]PHL00158.1 AMP-dependent synthetase [Neolewinella marina]